MDDFHRYYVLLAKCLHKKEDIFVTDVHNKKYVKHRLHIFYPDIATLRKPGSTIVVCLSRGVIRDGINQCSA